MLPIEIRASSGEWKTFYVEVDSGAVVSVFNKYDCESLGYSLKDGKFFEICSVLGGKTPAYTHELNIRIIGEEFTSRIAFTDAKKHKQLLGRLDVFDKFQFLLDGKALKTFVVKV